MRRSRVRSPSAPPSTLFRAYQGRSPGYENAINQGLICTARLRLSLDSSPLLRATGRAKRDVAADLKGALAPKASKNYAAITIPAKVGELLRAIEGYDGQPATAAALKLAAYVFARPGEIRAAEWSEFDLDGAEWRIPAERMKMDEYHIVPLSTQAVAILRELHPLTGRGRLVFPAIGKRDRPLSENTLNGALRRLGYASAEMTAHGFRTTASTLLNEQGWHPDLIELQLAHAERNKVRAAPNRAQRLDERRKMMQAWANYLDMLRISLKSPARPEHNRERVDPPRKGI
jgi:integrase